jgi:hypothetical protein
MTKSKSKPKGSCDICAADTARRSEATFKRSHLARSDRRKYRPPIRRRRGGRESADNVQSLFEHHERDRRAEHNLRSWNDFLQIHP